MATIQCLENNGAGLHRMCRKSGRWLLRQVRACPKTAAGRPSAIHPHRASPSPALRLIALDTTILTETRSQTWPWGKICLSSREIFYQEIPVRGVQARAVQARGGRAEASERCHGGHAYIHGRTCCAASIGPGVPVFPSCTPASWTGGVRKHQCCHSHSHTQHHSPNHNYNYGLC